MYWHIVSIQKQALEAFLCGFIHNGPPAPTNLRHLFLVVGSVCDPNCCPICCDIYTPAKIVGAPFNMLPHSFVTPRSQEGPKIQGSHGSAAMQRGTNISLYYTAGQELKH